MRRVRPLFTEPLMNTPKNTATIMSGKRTNVLMANQGVPDIPMIITKNSKAATPATRTLTVYLRRTHSRDSASASSPSTSTIRS